MKSKHLLAVGLAAAFGLASLSARTWTSADGTKTFVGEFKSYDEDTKKVTVIMRSGKTVTFDEAKLSEADRTFVIEQAKAANAPNLAEALQDQKIGASLSKDGVLQKLQDGKYQDAELEKVPEHYVIYFGASW